MVAGHVIDRYGVRYPEDSRGHEGRDPWRCEECGRQVADKRLSLCVRSSVYFCETVNEGRDLDCVWCKRFYRQRGLEILIVFGVNVSTDKEG